MCGANADCGRLFIEWTCVLTDQHVRDVERGEARSDREQLGFARDAEHYGDGSRRSGTALAGGVGYVGSEDACWQVFADDHVVGLGGAARRGTRSGISLGVSIVD